MNLRMTFAVGALAVALVLAAAPRAEAGGIVYWGGTRVISTGTPVVTATAGTAHVAGRAYEVGYKEGYEQGFSDGVRTETRRTVVTRTVVVPTYTVRRSIGPRVVIRSRPFLRIASIRPSRCRRSWHRGHRGYLGHRGHRSRFLGGSGLVIRW